MTATPKLISLDQPPADIAGDIEIGEMLVSVSVFAANVVRDIQQNLRNLVGGRMGHYENLVENAIETALEKLRQKAFERGYDGVLGVKIAHPQVVDGGVEIVVYGNGYRHRH